MIKALAVVHAVKQADDRSFAAIASGGDATLSLFMWDEEQTTQRHRLALLKAVEELPEGEVRLFLIADKDLAAMLTAAGMGRATALVKPVEAGLRPTDKSTARPAALTAGLAPAQRRAGPGQHLLSERARRALETLTVKNKQP